ncbi:HupE/UreJ family protein [Hoeflea sp.]|uniref:HupE/UreJ family protein n=1 Tax=Hoeflea sp. TaxID=1940281 RepID=UPI003B016578
MRAFEGRCLHYAALSWKVLIVCALTCLAPVSAYAHFEGGTLGGFQSGFAHPIIGADHLLAMLAVGIWGAQMGGRSVWTLPVTFPLIMAAGGIFGMSGLPLPNVELGIALSVFVLGLAIGFAWKAPEWAALLLIAVFAVFHGYAHGVELPRAVDPASYSIGFVAATGAIHVAGIGIGLLLGRLWKGRLSQSLGGAIAATGLYFAASPLLL